MGRGYVIRRHQHAALSAGFVVGRRCYGHDIIHTSRPCVPICSGWHAAIAEFEYVVSEWKGGTCRYMWVHVGAELLVISNEGSAWTVCILHVPHDCVNMESCITYMC